MTIRFTDFIQNKDAVSFKDAFEESVSKKVFEALEAKKVDVAQGFFGESHGKMCPECEKSMEKCSCEEFEQVNEVNTPGHITRALEDKYGPAQATMVNSSKTEVTHLTRHLDDDGGDAYEQRTHKLHLGPTGKLKDSTIGKLISHKGKPKKKVVDMDEEVEQVDEAKLPPLHKRTERQQIAHDLGLDQEYSKKYPGGEKQRAKDNTAFLKRFPPPKNEEVEQVDEKKKSHMLVVPKKPDPKTGRKDVKKIPSHMWAQMKDTHYQAEETEIEEGKDPSMDAGVGSEPIFVQNANTSSNPSPKHTPMSKAKELAHKSISKIKADLGRK